MIDVDRLKGEIKSHRMTQAEVAIAIGIHPVTFSKKLNKGILNSNEMEALVKTLSIENPSEIFFA